MPITTATATNPTPARQQVISSSTEIIPRRIGNPSVLVKHTSQNTSDLPWCEDGRMFDFDGTWRALLVPE